MTLEAKNLGTPDETRVFTHGGVSIVDVGGVIVARGEFEPGWRWSNDVKPIAGTASCQVPHTGYLLAGRMHVQMDDGTGLELGPGDAIVISPGHDAWIVGDETCVLLDWSGGANYAKPAE